MPFGIVAYGFVGQPFSKQLYVKTVLLLDLNLLMGFSFKIWRVFYLSVFVYFFFLYNISKPAGASPNLISPLAIFHLG